MFGIAITDVAFSGIYVLEDEYWIQSGACKFLGLLQTVSIEMSFVTFSTLKVLYVYVLGYKKHTGDIKLSHIILPISALWLIILSLLVAQAFTTENLHLGLCMFINNNFPGWCFSLVFFLLNQCLHIISTLSVCKLLHILYSQAQALKQLGNVSKATSRSNTKAFFVISLVCNLICGMPIQVFLVLMAAGVEINPSAIAWMTVLVFPMGSIANPFIHTMRAFILSHRKKK